MTNLRQQILQIQIDGIKANEPVQMTNSKVCEAIKATVEKMRLADPAAADCDCERCEGIKTQYRNCKSYLMGELK
jgi:hypothetical protein